MLVLFAVILGGIVTGRLLQSRRLAFVSRLIAVIIWALLFLLGLEVGSDPAVVGGMATLGRTAFVIFVFSVGVLLSNFAFNTYAMRRPFVGAPVSYREYFRGSLPTHLVGMLGGAVWCLGTAFSYIAAGKAGAAISYALGQGAPMIAAVWGVFIWK